MERRYVANCDDGHDYFEFFFYSSHRANSKANYEDCKREYRKRHGKRNFEIKQTQITELED